MRNDYFASLLTQTTMALSPAEMHEAIVKNLPKKTGKDIQEWIVIAASFKGLSDKELLNTLKSEFGLGHFQAQTIIRCYKSGVA